MVVAAHGGPNHLAREVWAEFRQPAPTITADPDSRLFDVSASRATSNGTWPGRWSRTTFGSAAGPVDATRCWTQHRPVEFTVRDAHSLYLETLAELGPLGLGLLLAVLGAPVVAAIRSRRHVLVPTALAAYVAYLAHAGIDWDWELPAVTLAALLCAGAILHTDRGTSRPLSEGPRTALVAMTVGLGVFAVVSLTSNSAMSASADAIARSDRARAKEEARKAERWAPWSSRPWQLLGQVERAQGDAATARAHFREALERNSQDWELWVALAGSTQGQERRRALAAAALLNPFVRTQERAPYASRSLRESGASHPACVLGLRLSARPGGRRRGRHQRDLRARPAVSRQFDHSKDGPPHG